MSLGHVDDAEFQAWANRVRARIDGGKFKEELGKSTKNIGTQGLRMLKSNTPVDTGALRRAWEAEGPTYQGKAWIIKFMNDTEYASYVENGHRTRGGGSWVAGQFFMRKSMTQLENQLPSLITDGLWAFRNLLD